MPFLSRFLGPTVSRRAIKANRENEMARLRKLLGPLMQVQVQRRRRLLQRVHVPVRRPSPKELAQTIRATSNSVIAKWPLEILEELCENPMYTFAFAGEIVAYENEPASTHGLIIVVRGEVGMMRKGCVGTTAQVSNVMALDPASRTGLLQFTPQSTFHSPCLIGEMLMLTDGVNGTCHRALSVCDFAIINAAKIRDTINTKLSPEQLNATFTKEVRLARKAMLRLHFQQTAPLMMFCWLTAELTVEDITQLIAHLRPEVAVPGEDIVVQGAAASTMYFIRRGKTCIVVGGKVIPGAVLGAGKSFGEMGLLFHERRMATVRATTVCDLWVLSQRSLWAVANKDDVKSRIISKAVGIRTKMISSIPRGSLLGAVLKYKPFEMLPEEGRKELFALLEPCVYPSSKILIAAGHKAELLVFVHSGLAATVDSQSQRYAKGDAIGVHSVFPHVALQTVAAVGVVDGFVLSASAARRLLRKYGLLDMSLAHSKEEIHLQSLQLGHDFEQVNLTKRQPKPARNVMPSGSEIVQRAHRSLSGNQVDGSEARSPSPRAARQAARAGAPHDAGGQLAIWRHIRGHPLEQPDVALQRPPCAAHAARIEAETVLAKWKLHNRAAEPSTFQLPKEPATTAKKEVVQEAAKKIWATPEFKELLRTDKYMHLMSQMPSTHHGAFTVLSVHSMRRSSAIVESSLCSSRSDSPPPPALVIDGGSATMIPDAMKQMMERRLQADNAGRPVPLLTVTDVDVPFMESINNSPTYQHQNISFDIPMEKYERRPAYRPINPHSYAAVMPLSVAPLTKAEITQEKRYGLRRRSQSSLADTDSWLSVGEIKTMAAHAEADTKRATRPKDINELLHEMLGVLSMEERQDIATLGDAALVDIDFLAEAWSDMTAPPPKPPSPKHNDSTPPQPGMPPQPMSMPATPPPATLNDHRQSTRPAPHGFATRQPSDAGMELSMDRSGSRRPHTARLSSSAVTDHGVVLHAAAKREIHSAAPRGNASASMVCHTARPVSTTVPRDNVLPQRTVLPDVSRTPRPPDRQQHRVVYRVRTVDATPAPPAAPRAVLPA